METEIRIAIYDLIITAPSLSKDNVFWSKADEEAEMPYLVISNVANPISRDTTPRIFSELHLNFTFYGVDLAPLESLGGEVEDLLDYGESALNALLTNYKVIVSNRQFRESNIHDQDRVFQYILNYIIETERVI